MQLIDIHTHSASGSSERNELVSYFHRSYIPETDLFSIGVHPWHAEKGPTKNLIDELYPKAYKAFAIGECGLDRASTSNWNKQVDVFKAQINLSEKLQKPLIIHAVKAYPDIIALYKIHKPTQAWILHGFRGNQQIMRQCSEHGIYLSYGAILMRGIKSMEETFRNTPDELLFLETDESSSDIDDIYNQGARIKGISKEKLADIIQTNFKSIQAK
ncbi:MAG TPA: TatD family hydrolase [Bacteroidales bacterium]|nr:TatD family hydrolase [Bacteroidales bacterium]